MARRQEQNQQGRKKILWYLGPENHVMFPCVVEMQGEIGARSDLQRWSAAFPDQVETTLPAAH